MKGASDHRIVVIAGGDYAGKSLLLHGLRSRMDWHVVSYDDDALQPPYDTLTALRRILLRDILPHADRLHSPDFLLAGLQMPVTYLRDAALAARSRGQVLVDSYYYKVLAKCVLWGLTSEDIFALWRRFPAPDAVIYLRTEPFIAWQRAQRARRLNRFEHYGDAPSYEGFARFQADLEKLILREITDLPTEIIDGNRPPSVVEAAVLDALRSLEREHPRTEPRIDHVGDQRKKRAAVPGGEGGLHRQPGPTARRAS